MSNKLSRAKTAISIVATVLFSGVLLVLGIALGCYTLYLLSIFAKVFLHGNVVELLTWEMALQLGATLIALRVWKALVDAWFTAAEACEG